MMKSWVYIGNRAKMRRERTARVYEDYEKNHHAIYIAHRCERERRGERVGNFFSRPRKGRNAAVEYGSFDSVDVT